MERSERVGEKKDRDPDGGRNGRGQDDQTSPSHLHRVLESAQDTSCTGTLTGRTTDCVGVVR